MGGAGCLRGREGGAAVGRVGGLGRVLKGHTGGPESGRRGPAGPQSPAHCPQASWRFERRSRTTVRSAALPSSPTPTAWWPSEDRRTSTGATGARWRVWTGGRKGAGGGDPRLRARAPARDRRVRVPTVCSRANSPRPSLWCTRPSPAAASSGGCVWVSPGGRRRGGEPARTRISLGEPRVTPAFPGGIPLLQTLRSGSTSGGGFWVIVTTKNSVFTLTLVCTPSSRRPWEEGLLA